jgi:hypothetical protein
MANKNISFSLEKKLDRDNKPYYVAKVKAPITINCNDGAVFLIFTADEGCEEMQLASLEDKPKSNERMQPEVTVVHRRQD